MTIYFQEVNKEPELIASAENPNTIRNILNEELIKRGFDTPIFWAVNKKGNKIYYNFGLDDYEFIIQED